MMADSRLTLYRFYYTKAETTKSIQNEMGLDVVIHSMIASSLSDVAFVLAACLLAATIISPTKTETLTLVAYILLFMGVALLIFEAVVEQCYDPVRRHMDCGWPENDSMV